jgi:hypothetical protein
MSRHNSATLAALNDYPEDGEAPAPSRPAKASKRNSKKAVKPEPGTGRPGAPRPTKPQDGPSTYAELKALPREDQVGAWAGNLKLSATELSIANRTGEAIKSYSVEKLRAATGPDACLGVWTSDLKNHKWAKCCCPQRHAWDDPSHEVDPDFEAKWNDNNREAKRKFRLSFAAHSN